MSADLDDFGQFGQETWTDTMPLDGDTGPDPARRDRADDAGAWPEDMDVRYVAASNLTVPGMGDQPESCGDWYPREFCGECAEPQLGASRCRNRQCPECWPQWTGEAAGRITRRLAAARLVEADGLDRRLVHTVSSPPEGTVRTIEEFQQLKRDGYQLAKEMGVRGGVAVAHGWRVKDHVQEAFNRLKDMDESAEWPDVDGVDAGIWKWIREKSNDWRKHVYWSPHVHIIGLARDVEETGSETREGWVHKRLSTLPAFQLHDTDSYDAMLGNARYILSHATFDPQNSRQSVRWFGSLAPASFSPQEELTEEQLDTVEAHTEEVRYGDDGGDDEDECCNCGSHDLHPIWEARQALQQQRWCEKVGTEQQRRLLVALDWATGELQPPPGLATPSTEAEAEETLAALIEMRHG